MKTTISIAAALCAFALTGCLKGNEGRVEQPQPAGTGTIDITLINGAPTISRAPSGTSAATEEEKKITMLEFFIFDPTGATPDAKVFNSATPNDTGYFKIEGATAGEALTASKYSINVTAEANKKILVAANMDLGRQTSFTEAKEALSAIMSTPRSIPAAGLEMSGVSEVNNITVGGHTSVPVEMTRLTSKVVKPTVAPDVAVALTQAELDELWGNGVVTAGTDEVTFAMIGYTVINGIDKSNVRFTGRADGIYTDPENSAWDTWTTKYYSCPSSFETNGNYSYNYASSNEDMFLIGDNPDPVFIFENSPAVIELQGATGYNPVQVTAIVIRGTLSTSGQTPVIRYWRVNMTTPDSYHIMRNCVYQLTVSKISTPGYATPKDAEQNESVVTRPTDAIADFIVSVKAWDLNAWTTEI